MKMNVSHNLSRIYFLLFHYPGLKKKHIRSFIKSPIQITPGCISLGKHVFVRNNARIEGVTQYAGEKFSPEIVFGDHCSIEQNLHLTCARHIHIGAHTAIASNVTITDINHQYEDISLPPEQQPITVDPVNIGESCKIYNNSVILPGVTLQRHTVVAANSVVTKAVYPEYCVLAGAPAKIIKKYDPDLRIWRKTNAGGEFTDHH